MARASSSVNLLALVIVCACGAERSMAPQGETPMQAASTPIAREAAPKRAPVPEQRAEPPVAEEGDGLSNEQISPVVQQRFAAVRGCHTMEYGGGGRAVGGSMTVNLQINADGSVGAASIADSSFENESLDECVLGVAKAIRFPTAAAPTDFSWRFRFRAPGSSTGHRSSL